MEHERHWSGAHCHECFIKEAMSEPHPLDEEFSKYNDLMYSQLMKAMGSPIGNPFDGSDSNTRTYNYLNPLKDRKNARS